jgi:hypothetical protein
MITASMRLRTVIAGLACALMVWVSSARPEARMVGEPASLADAAVRELLEGKNGHRETWASAPALVIVTSVMNYTGNDLPSGYAALDETVSASDVTELTADLTRALSDLTAGTFRTFRSITVETPAPGTIVKVVRPGQIVVGRFRGVQAKTGSLGYGGRMTHDTQIVGAAVVLDAAFDRQSDRRQLLRTHELGHALGYNHVESRPSVMNPRVGSSLTDFDRAAIRLAFPEVDPHHRP